MRRALLYLLTVVFALCCMASPAIAQDLSAVESVTFNQMPPFEQDGFWPAVGEYAESIGYEVARSWVAGEFPADVLKIGDILDGLHPEQFRLSDLAALEALSIADVGLIADLPLAELLRSVPFSGDWPIGELPGVEAALKLIGIPVQLTETLNQAIAINTGLGEMLTGDVFGQLPLSTLPNIESAQIADFAGFQNQAISSVPGLGDTALGNFPNPLALVNFTAQQDIAFGLKEYSGEIPTPKPVSGSLKAGFRVPCVGGCPHIELSGPGWQGDQWMTKDHRVPDGSGLLGSLPGMGEAGAYRLPFGEAFALQVRSTDEKTGAADWGIAFRVCAKRLFVNLGCTAYFLEVPLGITTYEKDTILTGIKDGQGGRSQPLKAPPGWEALRPATPSDLQRVLDRYTSGAGSGGRGLCGKGPGGIDYEALALAFSKIEGGYSSVGQYVSGGTGGRGQTLYGRGLGRYQYMSYREDVRAEILKQPGGRALLAKADSGAPISAGELERSFPADVQDRLFRADQEKLINQAISEGAEGIRIVERIGQMHYGGSRSTVDGDARDAHGKYTIRGYGEELSKTYLEAVEGGESACGKATGNFISPITGHYTKTSPFGWRIHPISGDRKFHSGVDLAEATGTPIVASDGGTVVFAGWSGGFGNHVEIDHNNGFTSSYSHLSAIGVKAGDAINQGEQLGALGTTGNSTGPHLHFIIKQNGALKDPENYVDL